ncbi:MAG TPA: glycoside hydrolase family 16 protein [Herpetosiphonaceae bacterium]
MPTHSRSLRSVCLLLVFLIGGGTTSLIGTAFGAKQAQAGWTLAWSDEFNGPNIDTSNWGYEIGYVRNNELQYYTNRPENARIENGQLLIEGRKESYNGYAYTSASLITKGKRQFQYGRIEMRAKLPYSQGTWPAFWTLGVKGSPVDTACWPATGEIDIMELIGGGVRDSQSYGTAHWNQGDDPSCGAGHASNGRMYQLPAGKFADDYHIFAVEWDATQIKWFVDGTQFHTLDITTANQSELRQPHYLLLNLAIGGNWPGSPDATSVFPMKYYIDYVRVYTPTGTPVTPTPTPPDGVNMLANPGLESGNSGWNAVSGSWSIVQPSAGNTHAGSWAFQMSTTQPYGSGSGPYQTITGIPTNTNYVARFWLKGTGSVKIAVNNGAWGYLGGTQCDATSTWTLCSFAFNTGSNTSLIVQMQDHRAGTAYVDDLYLGVPPGAVNKLTNPGLESGNTGWSAVSSSWSIVQPGTGNTHAGSWAFKMSTTQPSWTGPYQTVTGIPSNTNYVARFWLKGTGNVRMSVNSGAWSYLGGAQCDATSTWTLCSFAFNTGSNSSLIIQMQDHGAGTAYVDDLYLGLP